MRNLAIKYGLIMFAGFSALFLFFYALGWAEHVELRSLNALIHVGGMFALIREYRKRYPETRHNYMKGTIIGILATALAVFAFAGLVFFTLELDPILLGQMKGHSPLPEYFTPFNASQFIITEGIVVGLVGAYIITRIVDARYDHFPSEGKVSKDIAGESK